MTRPVFDPFGRESYVIGENTSGWRESRDGIVFGEPLCCGCDAPIADGPCGCVTPANRQQRLARERRECERKVRAA